MPSDLAPDVGGVLHLEYRNAGAAVAHPIRLAVLPFSVTPSGPDGDYLYDVPPGETGILATFAALAARWAPYYSADWMLHLVDVWQNVSGFPELLSAVPTAVPVPGSYSGPTSANAVVRRTLHFYTTLGSRWRTRLRQVPGTLIERWVNVSTLGGGLDSRDVAWYTYFQSAACAVVGRDGARFQPGGQVSAWWDAPLTEGVTGPYVVSG